MKRTIAILLASVLAFAMLAGCATTFKTTDGKLSYGNMQGTTKGNFSVEKSYLYILSPTILSIGKPFAKLDEVIKPAVGLKGANAATNLQITSGFHFLGFLVTYLTAGLFGLDYVKVTGTAIAQ